MTKEELISHFCDYRGKCTSDDVAALTFAYRMLAPRWISVEDELPKKTGFYNVVLNGDAYSLWYYPSINEWAEIYADEAGYLQNRKMEGVTHWQRLAAPPKKGD